MRLSPRKKEQREWLQKMAYQRYKQGFSTREVASAVGKSHSWVALAVRKYSRKSR